MYVWTLVIRSIYTDAMRLQLAVIAQGVAARYALRQASSEKAFMYSKFFPLIGQFAWNTSQDADNTGVKVKL